MTRIIDEPIDAYTILKQKYVNVNNFNEDYLIWYTLFVYESRLEQKLDGRLSENHHFLPEGDFPEYASFKLNPSNKAILQSRNHFIAHYLLFETVNTQTNTCAFNQMKRVLDKENANDMELGSMLYENARVRINTMLSEMNIGRKHSKEVCEATSKRLIGKVVVYDTKDPLKRNFQTDVTDPKYISGEYVFLKTGSKHKKETIDKMIENSGIVGKTTYHHKDTHKLKYFDEAESITSDYIKGFPEESRIASSIRITGLNYYYNQDTLEQGRFYDGEQPENWIPGKPFFGAKGNPFASNKIYRNFMTNETGMVLLNDPYPKYCGNSAIKENSRYAYIYKNYVSFNSAHLENITGFPAGLISTACDRIKSGTHNRLIKLNYVNKNYVDILKNYKTYTDLGISVIKLSEFFEMPNFEQYEWVG